MLYIRKRQGTEPVFPFNCTSNKHAAARLIRIFRQSWVAGPLFALLMIRFSAIDLQLPAR